MKTRRQEMKNKHLAGFLLLAVAGLLILSGCATERETMIQQGYPPAYADGYDDGCHSGKAAAGSMFDHFTKNVQRFSSDSQYAQGWKDGFNQCKAKQEALQKQHDSSIEQQRLLEEKRHDKWEEKHHSDSDMLKGIKYDPALLNKLGK
jgi:flagellar biosynthesis/type III secretory pathway protein FliH